jgi:L-amino acid N-acyltransferase YncA
MIRLIKPSDFTSICEIYNHYVTKSTITFDLLPLTIEEVKVKIEYNYRYPCVVYEQSGNVVGFAASSEWKAKKAYEQTVETSIYLSPEHCRQGLGTLLLKELICLLRSQGIHSVISGIIMPNPASVLLHEKCNFKKVAHLSEVGTKFGEWLDVSYWQLIL